MPSTIASFPAPQPTRAQLRKSTRKIESVLGATPLVLELDPTETTSSPAFMETTPKTSSGRAPITPRTRARRRRGQVFGGYSSSSSTSSSAADSRSSLDSTLESTDASSAEEEDEKAVLDSTASDASYVFISSTTPKAGYVPRPLPSSMGGIPVETFRPLPHSNSYLMHDPNPKLRPRSNTKSASKGLKEGEKKKDPAGGDHDIRRKRSKSDAPTKSKLTPLAQPVVFRMRSTPRPLPTPPSSMLAAPSASSSSGSISSTSSDSRPRSHSKSSSLGSIREPLTPPSSMFSNRLSMMPEEAREQKERELKRRKMEKVKRTLGENVPPELVFGSRPPPASAPPSIPASHATSISSTNSGASTHVRLPARKTVNGKKPRPRSLSVPVAHPPFLNVEIDTTPDPMELPPLEPAPEPRPHVHSAPSAPPRVLNAAARPRSHSKSHSHSAITTLSISPASSSDRYARSGQVKKGYYAPHDVGTTIGYKGKCGKVMERTAFATLVQGSYSSINELGLYPSAVQAVMGPVRAGSLDLPPTHRSGSLDGDRTDRTRANLTPIHYVYGVKGKKEGGDDMEDWKRKEREWSGEWNVQDMGDVVRRLRGLKAA